MENPGHTMNLLKQLEELISSHYLTPASLHRELHRMAHRQFPWQRSVPNGQKITRYYLIYKYAPLEALIKTKIGLNVDELLLMGIALLGNFFHNLTLWYPPSVEIPGLSLDALDRFLCWNPSFKHERELR
jgi:hypothetical protein